MRGAIEGKVRGMTNIYYNQNGAPTNFQTQVMNSDYVTSSKSETDIAELANTTQTHMLVGGGNEAEADEKGETTRTGKTTYFGQ
jgi:hypothetical protein